MTRRIDLVGKKFGKLTVLYQTENHISKNGNSRLTWHCKCECGNEVDVMGLNLTRNHTTSCGCARADGRKKLQRDITGERFGNLIGIRKVENKNGQTRWLFKCDCGNEVECYLSNVTTGKTKSCGKQCGLRSHTYDNVKRKGNRKNLVGQRFGRLLVVEQLDDKNGWTQFKCKCDCGNEKITSGNNLVYGATKSCGCLHKEVMKNNFSENLIGKRFNKIVVIKKVESKYNKTHWLCKCDCGNEVIVSTGGLKSGHTQSCGCYQDEVASDTHFNDLSGRRFGRLIVIERAENSKRGYVRFKCKCDCGNIVTVHAAPLMDGRTQSCGCWKYSKLEEFVIRYFKEKNYINTVDYECQKKFDNLIGTGKMQLSYDFIIYKNNEPFCLIECQGQQHYHSVEYFGGEESFKKQQIHDKLKRDYAEMLEIPLIEIEYTLNKYADIKRILEENEV